MSLSVRFLVPFALVFLFLLLYGCPGSGEAKQPAQQTAKAEIVQKQEAPVKPQPVQAKPVCGNRMLESGEQCEGGVGCEEGKACNDATCKCEARKPAEPVPAAPICGNGAVEAGETCETDSECANGMMCTGCSCVPKPAPKLQEAFCGNGQLEIGEECDVGTAASPAGNKCPAGEYCSACKCYTAAEPVSCLSNHKYVKATGVNQFIWTTLPACGDDCAFYGVDYKCDLRTCTCIVKSVTSHTCGNNIKETVEECDGTDNSWCKTGQTCGQECTCVNASGGAQ